MTESSSNIVAGQSGPGDAKPAQPIAFQDVALVDRCRKGDMQAFGLLVAKYQDRVLNLMHRLCGNPGDAEELAQETFLKALERLAQFRGQSQFYTWLFRIAANLALTHRRKGSRVKFHPLLPGDGDETGGQAQGLIDRLADSREPAPHAAAISAETSRKVLEALEQLDDEFRLIVVLRDVEDMDYEQIGQVLDVPVGTVKSRLHRARGLLKEKLTELLQ